MLRGVLRRRLALSSITKSPRPRRSLHLAPRRMQATSTIFPAAGLVNRRILPNPHLSGLPSKAERHLHVSASALAPTPFKLPDIGEGIAEVEMLKWKVKVGQRVEHFDDLCEVQSDKSTAEISAPFSGVIHSLNFDEGQMVQVGQTLCEIVAEDEDSSEVSPSAHGHPETTRDSTKSSMAAEGGGQTIGLSRSEAIERTLAGGGKVPASTSSSGSQVEMSRAAAMDSFETDEAAELSGGAKFVGEASILPSAPPPTIPSYDMPVPAREEHGEKLERKVVLTSPAVRSLARRLDVDLERVQGSGDKGRIRKEDVEAYAARRDGSGNAFASSSKQTLDSGDRSKIPEITRVEFGRTRKVMWKALGAQGSVPHFGYSHTLDLTPLLPYLKLLNPTSTSSPTSSYMASDIPANLARSPLADSLAVQKTTLLTFFVKTLLMAMEEHPIMRSRAMTKDDQRTLEIRRDPIVGIAVSDPKNGLLTPSLPAMPPSTSLSQLTAHLSTLRAKPTAPGPAANVVISSIGGLGEGMDAMPVIPPGGPVAICAIGRAQWEVEWVHRDGGTKSTPEEVEKAGTRAVLRCSVGWSGDHRVLEGAELIAFTESWRKWIERPWTWIKVDT